MKTKFYFFSMLILTGLFLVNCSDDESTPAKKYLISTAKINGVLFAEYTYNTSNYITQMKYSEDADQYICNYTVGANGEINRIDVVINSQSYGAVVVQNNANNLPTQAIAYFVDDTSAQTFEYDAMNRPIKIKFFGSSDVTSANYTYMTLVYNAAGNVVQETYWDNTIDKRWQYDYEYDTKNGMFSSSNIKWSFFLVWGGENSTYYFSKNNLTKQVLSYPAPAETSYFTYEYNADGYPTKQIDGADTYLYTYTVK